MDRETLSYLEDAYLEEIRWADLVGIIRGEVSDSFPFAGESIDRLFQRMEAVESALILLERMMTAHAKEMTDRLSLFQTPAPAVGKEGAA